jgi:tetratricopeptide repeat protein 30
VRQHHQFPAGLCATQLAIHAPSPPAGNYEFGITRVLRSLEPLPAVLDAARWRGVALCLLCLLDQVAKNMLVLKDALVADLLAFLEDVEAAGKGIAAQPLGPPAPPSRSGLGSGGGSAVEDGVQVQVQLGTVAAQARALRALFLQLSE